MLRNNSGGKVALRKESVDRNTDDGISPTFESESLSARRAWIEMFGLWACPDYLAQSLSARRAWIEIP